MKRFTVKELPEKALTSTDVIQRVKNHRIQDSLDEAIGETSGKIMERVEKALNSGYVLYTSQELSATLYADKVPELVLITDKFDTANRSNRKFQSIIQKSKNLGATVTIVKINTPAGTRLEQLGGFICVIRQ
jgi:stalled ribosome rescue protein Dom34